MIVTAACSVFMFLCAWACVDRVMSKMSEFLTFPHDIPDLPERVPKRISLISTIGSCPELADLGDYGSAVTQFEALERNPIQMTWSVLETLPCVIVLKQSAADAARYAQVLRSAGYAGIIFVHVPKSVSHDARNRLVERNAASIDGATSDARAVVRLYSWMATRGKQLSAARLKEVMQSAHQVRLAIEDGRTFNASRLAHRLTWTCAIDGERRIYDAARRLAESLTVDHAAALERVVQQTFAFSQEE